jgi:hypothetical protein
MLLLDGAVGGGGGMEKRAKRVVRSGKGEKEGARVVEDEEDPYSSRQITPEMTRVRTSGMDE